MNPFRFACLSATLLCLFSAAAAFAQDESPPGFRSTVALPGKDVGWLPTEQALVELMLDMAKVTPRDTLVDLGSGDGRTVITAAKRGARSLGVEYNPELVSLSQRNAAAEGVADRAAFIQADLFATDFSRATVVTLFLRGDLNLRLRPRILAMEPGTRVVSNSFPMEEWIPDQIASIEEERCRNYCCTAYFWVVPARVAGTWTLAQGELTLDQSFQMISGTLGSGAESVPVTGRLLGREIRFSGGDAVYTGRVDGAAMQGAFVSHKSAGPWTAVRKR